MYNSFIISNSVSQFLLKLAYGKNQSKKISFIIAEHEDINTRIKEGESVSTWFKRAVDATGDYEKIDVLDDTIAVFPIINVKKSYITSLSIQAFISLSGTVEDCYCKCLDEREIKATYCRLDFHPSELGKLFSHPMPHLHIGNMNLPRMPIAFKSCESSILDFLEFLYINYKYDVWLDWVKTEWRKKRNKFQCDDPLEDKDYFVAIQNGFREGKICELISVDEYRATIDELKELLEKRKKEFSEQLFKLSPCCSLTNYLGY